MNEEIIKNKTNLIIKFLKGLDQKKLNDKKEDEIENNGNDIFDSKLDLINNLEEAQQILISLKDEPDILIKFIYKFLDKLKELYGENDEYIKLNEYIQFNEIKNISQFFIILKNIIDETQELDGLLFIKYDFTFLNDIYNYVKNYSINPSRNNITFYLYILIANFVIKNYEKYNIDTNTENNQEIIKMKKIINDFIDPSINEIGDKIKQEKGIEIKENIIKNKDINETLIFFIEKMFDYKLIEEFLKSLDINSMCINDEIYLFINSVIFEKKKYMNNYTINKIDDLLNLKVMHELYLIFLAFFEDYLYKDENNKFINKLKSELINISHQETKFELSFKEYSKNNVPLEYIDNTKYILNKLLTLKEKESLNLYLDQFKLYMKETQQKINYLESIIKYINSYTPNKDQKEIKIIIDLKSSIENLPLYESFNNEEYIEKYNKLYNNYIIKEEIEYWNNSLFIIEELNNKNVDPFKKDCFKTEKNIHDTKKNWKLYEKKIKTNKINTFSHKIINAFIDIFEQNKEQTSKIFTSEQIEIFQKEVIRINEKQKSSPLSNNSEVINDVIDEGCPTPSKEIESNKNNDDNLNEEKKYNKPKNEIPIENINNLEQNLNDEQIKKNLEEKANVTEEKNIKNFNQLIKEDETEIINNEKINVNDIESEIYKIMQQTKLKLSFKKEEINKEIFYTKMNIKIEFEKLKEYFDIIEKIKTKNYLHKIYLKFFGKIEEYYNFTVINFSNDIQKIDIEMLIKSEHEEIQYNSISSNISLNIAFLKMLSFCDKNILSMKKSIAMKYLNLCLNNILLAYENDKKRE